MGEITASERIVLELIAIQGKRMTTEEIQALITQKEPEIEEVEPLLQSLQSHHFLRSEEGITTTWHITMRGLLASGIGVNSGWP